MISVRIVVTAAAALALGACALGPDFTRPQLPVSTSYGVRALATPGAPQSFVYGADVADE